VGFLGTVIGGPDWFIAEQISGSKLVATSDNSQMVALQLGNLYLLMALIGIAVLTQATDPKVVRNYLIALWIGDIGHIYMCYHVLGHQRFAELGQWNAATWGNVGFTVGALPCRCPQLFIANSSRRPFCV
jgi:hypothetical protein